MFWYNHSNTFNYIHFRLLNYVFILTENSLQCKHCLCNLDQTVTDIKCLFDKGDTQDVFKTETIWASKSKARYCAWSSSLFPAFIVKSLQSDLDQYWKEQLFYCHEFITEVVGSVEPNSVFVQEKDLRSRKNSWNNNKDLDFL